MNNQLESNSMSTMKDDLKIRTATKDDLPSLLDLYQHLNADEPILTKKTATQIFDQLQKYNGSQIFIGEIGKAIVTTCTLIAIPNLTRGGAPYALLENVVTHQKYRQHGFGRAILNAAVSSAWNHGCYKVMLLTGSKDGGTLEFYKKAGFTQDKTGFQIRRVPKKP
jgi:N-acetylglutamate synthase-like GNAT family acetyltransferase